MSIKPKEIAVLGGILLILIFSLRGFSNVRADALIAEERVRVLEEERIELERQMEEAAEGYEILRDSLDQAHDSIAEVREGAVAMASRASISFATDLGMLRDSINAVQPDSGLGEIVDRIQADHETQVQAYEVQIETLEADNLLLWRRVEVSDSLWIQEQNLNASLRNEIAALNQESDAWQRAANPSIFRRLGGSIPYILVGAGAIVLLN
jgi:chromosome segregation ATPase